MNKENNFLEDTNDVAHIFAYFGLAACISFIIKLYITGFGFDSSTSIMEEVVIFTPFAFAAFYTFNRFRLKGKIEQEKKSPDLIDKVLSYTILALGLAFCLLIVIAYLSSL